jgi:cysteinyl-tRNA synthetase
VRAADEGAFIMKIYNSMTGGKEELVPITPGKIGMYACGVTVYDRCHIGHARSAIVFDVINRYLKYKGFDTRFVRNFTDVDDKIIKRAHEENMPWDAVAEKYITEYYLDMDMLGVARADVEPKATEHIKEIIDVIAGLIDKGYAYTVSEGPDSSVYFSVGKFADYGKLSKKDLDDLLSGARVSVDERKQSPVDFALWKASKEGEPFWESPWGKGRPGWHIECTAMAIKHLGESIDIHGGGADLTFPHHENEIAQSEAYTGRPFARYWVHNGFITIDKEKMSKSLGNFFTIRDVLEKYDPEVIRLFVISSHYRSPIEFSNEQLHDAEASLDRFYTTIARMDDFVSKTTATPGKPAGKPEQLEKILAGLTQAFEDAMDDDFNSALAVGRLFELVREINRYLDMKPGGEDSAAMISRAKETLVRLGAVLNLFSRTPHEWNVSLLKVRNIPLTEADIEGKISDRKAARDNKDWAKADEVRKELDNMGILLEDKKDGTSWKVKIF